MRQELTPRALWLHHPSEDFQTEKFVSAVVNFQTQHGFSMVKVTPRSSFCVRDYGCIDDFQADRLGRTVYRDSILKKQGWRALQSLDPEQGYLGQQLECLRKIRHQLGSKAPIYQTVFSPLIQARNLCASDTLGRETDLSFGLEVIAESTRRFVAKLFEITDGIFYVVREENGHEPSELIQRLDTSILEAYSGVRMLHLHGATRNFLRYCHYPISILHWDEKLVGVSLEQGKKIFPGIVSGGINWPSLGWESEAALADHCREVCERVGPDRFILAPSCVIPYETPAKWIEIFRHTRC